MGDLVEALAEVVLDVIMEFGALSIVGAIAILLFIVVLALVMFGVFDNPDIRL